MCVCACVVVLVWYFCACYMLVGSCDNRNVISLENFFAPWLWGNIIATAKMVSNMESHRERWYYIIQTTNVSHDNDTSQWALGFIPYVCVCFSLFFGFNFSCLSSFHQISRNFIIIIIITIDFESTFQLIWMNIHYIVDHQVCIGYYYKQYSIQ